MQRVYSLLVDNTPGVLSRISGLFSRRGYSIDSITAGVTADPRFTRITIVASGDELILSQIEKQVRKLEDVIEIKVLKEGESVYRELIMVKVRANAAQRAEIIAVADIFRAKVVDVEKESLILELTGSQSKLEAFLDLLDGYGIEVLAVETKSLDMPDDNKQSVYERMISERRIDCIQFEFGSTTLAAHVSFHDLYTLLKPEFDVYRLLKRGMRRIDRYRETDEIFMYQNLVALRRR